jgi:hypothetical protein
MVDPTHHVVFTVQECSARIGAASWLYFGIAQAGYDAFLADEESSTPEPGNDEDPTVKQQQTRRLLENSVKTVVFAAMALEAGIYDVAAIQLGDKFAMQVLDKLDLVGKWLVVPQMVCGKSLVGRND